MTRMYYLYIALLLVIAVLSLYVVYVAFDTKEYCMECDNCYQELEMLKNKSAEEKVKDVNFSFVPGF